ncbi:hypothetical protein BCV70DRAFT_200291 [Testicularia cyperi]|uniref:Uncharacterized protein n=1 Tax=Testicularia cyperi TaxID=1882483 RepID=A0A317XS00_9BASI|nr:hypothetical protein BCV70DRAFT_200291 [Testicularia cyperi]
MSKLLRNGIPRKENGKIDFSWKNHYGFTGLIWLLGFIFPPLAVAIRFGIGKDFLINVPLTICGWIPGQLHNWFIQNIRNNDTKNRTPRWAIRYGLVDDRPAKKLAKSRAWTGRYNDRNPQRVLYDDDGNAHYVDDATRAGSTDDSNSITSSSNHHHHHHAAAGAGAGGLRPQRTGLVEADQWINEDGHDARSIRPSYSDAAWNQDASGYTAMSESQSKRSMGRLFSKRGTKTTSAIEPITPTSSSPTDRHSSITELNKSTHSFAAPNRHSYTRSAHHDDLLSSSGAAVPAYSDDEDDQGPEYPTRSTPYRRRAASIRSNASGPLFTPTSQQQSQPRREADIFAHEF